MTESTKLEEIERGREGKVREYARRKREEGEKGDKKR